MSNSKTFTPGYGTGITVATSAASGANTVKANSSSVVLTNLGNVTVYVRVGAAAAAATIADYPVISGTQVSVNKPAQHTHISYISPDGAGSLQYIAGAGF